MALLVCGVDVVLYGSSLDGSEETAFFLYLEEQFPSNVSQRGSEFLDEVRTCRWVNDLVEVALLLKQELLVAGDALGEVGRCLVSGVEWVHYNGVNTCEGCTHGLRLCT